MENVEKKIWTAPVIMDLDVNLNTASTTGPHSDGHSSSTNSPL